MEREPRKEITLERANEIAEKIRRLETAIERIGRSTQMKIHFFNEVNTTTHRSREISTEFAEGYIKELHKRLDQLKKRKRKQHFN